ncbi:MAG: tetratricopeptide repeat protein [Candidatus Omnitrophota bacterium]|nr:MAG: tetratricopeptide repeat protein [Candidatus Omnitrophota bacterium]
MRSSVGVVLLLSIFFFGTLSTAQLSVVNTADAWSTLTRGVSEVTLYLKSGEIIKGKFLKKTDTTIIIEKYGSSVSFPIDDVFKVAESQTGKILLATSRLPFLSAIITYEYKGWQKGREVAYIDAASNRIALEESMMTRFADLTQENRELTIYDGKVAYMINLDKNEAIVMEQEGEVVAGVFLEQLHFGQPTRKESFLGKECTVYQYPQGEAYFWHGILLKEKMTAHPMGEQYNFTKEAVDIKLNVPIPSEKFRLPQGVHPKTMEELWKDFGKITEEMKEEQTKWKKEAQEQQRKYLLERAEKEPEIKKILEEVTENDGSIDVEEANRLITKLEEKKVIEKAKKFDGADEIIKEATSQNGSISVYKLQSFVWEKEGQMRDKMQKIIDAGRVYEEQGNYQEALNKYTEAINLDPKNTSAYLARYYLYEMTGKDTKAIDDLTTLIETKDLHLESMCLPYRGDIYARIGEYHRAVLDYTKAIELGKNQARKRTEEEKALFKEIGEEVKKLDWQKTSRVDSFVLKKRGDVYRKMDQFMSAVEDFTAVIEQNPSKKLQADCYFLRGLAYRAMGKEDKMRADLEKAESLGNKLVEGTWRVGKKQGHFIWYYTDGTVKSEADYRDNKFHGKYTNYYPNGAIKAQGTYANGRLEGVRMSYHGNGRIKEKGNYRDGRKTGIFISYDSVRGHKTKEMNYANGKLEGECRWYYDNGRLMEKSMFKGGVRHGMHRKYYENGRVQQEGPFADGLEHGTMVLYKQDGSVKKRIIFKEGKRIKDIYP